MAAALKTTLLAPGMRVGLYGGSFDPVHDGHVHVARTALKRLDLDRIWWLASPGNRLKPHAPATLAKRVKAIRTRAPGPRHVVSTLETQLGANTTIDLIRHLRGAHPQVRFVWIMGADGLRNFHRWTSWKTIAHHTPSCVVSRPDEPLKARLGPAARQLQTARQPESRAKSVVTGQAPGWTYLTEPLHSHASCDLRTR